ncbi:MAG TPA: heterodisulfide reductase-related iron-sulfur binding cluster [Magnetospirillaceae bacterium]|jgi:glycerol-3-phosphate dehydrogenase subunit C
MKEGGLDKPTRHPLAWHDPEFYDEKALDTELRRVFDICHGCRRCFNLCDSFPRLFDLVDNSPTEMEGVKSEDFKPVVDACTLCDMCYMTKCPYVPPHPFNLDFPHLMLRARVVAEKKGEVGFIDRQLVATDRNGRIAGLFSLIVNWATDTKNTFTRVIMEKLAGVHRKAHLPRFSFHTFEVLSRARHSEINVTAPAAGRKAVIYATCFVNYNNPDIGEAAQAVLEKNGVATEVVYPECCGMPQLEHGDLKDVAGRAKRIAKIMKPYVDKGYAIVALVPSCSLMLRSEWPLLIPDDPEIMALSKATRDISEYVMDIANKEGLAPGLQPIEDGSAWLQLACHARAQNVGAKAAEMLRLIPDFKVGVIERCSGHGGSWGILKENFETGLKVGKPVARQVAEQPRGFVTSECPLAADHIVQGAVIIAEGDGKEGPARSHHPIEIFAQAYGVKAGKGS